MQKIIDSLVPIITALIACYALLRTSKIEYSQKRQRAHWFFEDYLFSVGKCIVNYESCNGDYYANYMRFLPYADKDVARQMKNIDNVIATNDKKKIINEVEVLKEIYTKKYKTDQYILKKR